MPALAMMADTATWEPHVRLLQFLKDGRLVLDTVRCQCRNKACLVLAWDTLPNGGKLHAVVMTTGNVTSAAMTHFTRPRLEGLVTASFDSAASLLAYLVQYTPHTFLFVRAVMSVSTGGGRKSAAAPNEPYDVTMQKHVALVLELPGSEKLRISAAIAAGLAQGLSRVTVAQVTHMQGALGGWRIHRSDEERADHEASFTTYVRGRHKCITVNQLSAATLEYETGYQWLSSIRDYLDTTAQVNSLFRTLVTAELRVKHNAFVAWFVRTFRGERLQRTLVEYDIVFDKAQTHTADMRHVVKKKHKHIRHHRASTASASTLSTPKVPIMQHATDAGSGSDSSSSSSGQEQERPVSRVIVAHSSTSRSSHQRAASSAPLGRSSRRSELSGSGKKKARDKE